MEKIGFRFKFVFNMNEEDKVIKLKNLLKKCGVVENTIIMRGDSSRVNIRCNQILKKMVIGAEYTTGSLWRSYGRSASTGYKTFYRDLCYLVIKGYVEGRVGSLPRGRGRVGYYRRIKDFVEVDT